MSKTACTLVYVFIGNKILIRHLEFSRNNSSFNMYITLRGEFRNTDDFWYVYKEFNTMIWNNAYTSRNIRGEKVKKCEYYVWEEDTPIEHRKLLNLQLMLDS